MKFGLFFTMDHYKEQGLTSEQHLQQVTEQVQAAEALGFECAWFTEQHFNAMDGLCADPITLMSYMAGKTTHIRLGSAVTLAALYHPVHLAEAYALLDVLSGGRIDIGIGASSMKRAYEVYGIPFESRRQLRDQAADTMLSLWGCEGPSLAKPDEKIEEAKLPLGLYPLQKPHPPLWISTSTFDRVPTILASQHNLLLDYLFFDFNISEVTSLKNKMKPGDSFPGNVASVIYTQLDDVDSAYSYLNNYYNDFLKAIRGPQFQMQQTWQDLQDQGHILCCSVNECRERVALIADQGLDQLLLGVGFGGVAHQVVMSTLKLFAEEVMPFFS